MTYKNLTGAVDRYTDGASIEAAAADAGVGVGELTDELRARGVELRLEDQAVTSTRY